MGEKGIEAPGGAPADAGGSSVHMVAGPRSGAIGALGELALPGGTSGPGVISSALSPGIPGVPGGGGGTGGTAGSAGSAPSDSSTTTELRRPPTG